MKVYKIYEVPDGQLCCLRLYPDRVIGEDKCAYFRQGYVGPSFCSLFDKHIRKTEDGMPMKCDACLSSII
jgi:hypothetical protein